MLHDPAFWAAITLLAMIGIGLLVAIIKDEPIPHYLCTWEDDDE